MKAMVVFDVIAVVLFVSLLIMVLLISYKEYNKGRFSQDRDIKL